MEYLVTNITNGVRSWIGADSAAEAVIACEAARQNKSTSAFKASHYSDGPVIDESCGHFACVGLCCNVTR